MSAADNKKRASGGDAASKAHPSQTDEAPVKLPADGLVAKLKAAALWSAGAAWCLPTFAGLSAIFKVIEPWKIDQLTMLQTRTQIALTGSTWEAQVHPGVRPDRQYMFAHNHTNHFDYAACYNATPHYKQGLNLEKHFKYPFYGWFMKGRRTVPVRPGEPNARERLAADFRQELDGGRSLLVFPEGTRTRTGRVAPFKTGIFMIARDLGVPIVPTAATGMFEMMNPNSMVIRPSHITVHMMEPVETEGLSDDEVVELAQEVRRQIAEKVDAWHTAQGLLG